jgi:hypothetical protein
MDRLEQSLINNAWFHLYRTDAFEVCLRDRDLTYESRCMWRPLSSSFLLALFPKYVTLNSTKSRGIVTSMLDLHESRPCMGFSDAGALTMFTGWWLTEGQDGRV